MCLDEVLVGESPAWQLRVSTQSGGCVALYTASVFRTTGDITRYEDYFTKLEMTPLHIRFGIYTERPTDSRMQFVVPAENLQYIVTISGDGTERRLAGFLLWEGERVPIGEEKRKPIEEFHELVTERFLPTHPDGKFLLAIYRGEKAPREYITKALSTQTLPSLS